jgi:hypothetical protein
MLAEINPVALPALRIAGTFFLIVNILAFVYFFRNRHRFLARVAAQTGDPDRAIAALQKLLSVPYEAPLPQNVPLTPALLRLDPMFDPLRNDPRFQKFIVLPGPKTADK